ncbi:MAG: hydroxypyruvate isomerase [Bacillota bacterium]
MPKLAANLTMLFTEVPFPERFGAARKAGFRSVEFLFPYDYSPEQVKGWVDEHGLTVVLHNLPSGNWAAGERGIAADPRRTDEFRAGVSKAITYARALGVPRLNCLAGKAAPGFSPEEHWKTLVENLRFAAGALGEAGLELLVEPINHYDMPGFVLNRTDQALALIEEVGAPNLYLQYDVYHAQREEGNLVPTIRQHLPKIRHIQIADNPGRHQPGTGEINYPFLLGELDRLGYTGYVSLEYIPEPNTVDSLGWIQAFGYSF